MAFWFGVFLGGAFGFVLGRKFFVLEEASLARRLHRLTVQREKVRKTTKELEEVAALDD